MSHLSRSVFLNLQTLGMAAILAVLVWFYAFAQDTGEVDFPRVPLFVDSQPGMLIDRVTDTTGATVDRVRVIVHGSRSALRELPRRNFVCRVQLPRVQLGDQPLVHEVSLGPEEFGLTGALQVSVDPPQLRITVVREGVQRMRVQTTDCTVGSPRRGYRVAGVTVVPTFVEVRGPAPIVQKYRDIPVVKVDVSDQAEDFTAVTRIVGLLDGSNVRSDTEITLRIQIQEEEIEQVFKLPVQILQPIDFVQRKLTPVPDRVTVTLRGPQREMRQLDETNLVLYADLFALYRDPGAGYESGGTYKVPLKLSILDDSVRAVRLVSTEEFRLEISR